VFHNAYVLAWCVSVSLAGALYDFGRVAEGPDPALARATYGALESLGERRAVPLWSAMARERMAVPLVRTGSWDELEERAPALLDDVRYLPPTQAARLLDMLGSLACARQDWPAARERKLRAAARAEGLSDSHRVYYGARAAHVLARMGHSAEAWAALEPLLEIADGGGLHPVAAGRAQLIAGMVLFDLGRLREARSRVEGLLATGTAGEDQRLEAEQILCDLDAAQGDLPSLERRLQELLSGSGRGPDPDGAAALHCQGRLSLLEGDFHGALVHLDQALAVATDPVTRFEVRVTRVHALLRLEGTDVARSEAAALVALARGFGSTQRLQRALTVQGRILRIGGDLPGAAGAFERALELARADGRELRQAHAQASLAQVALELEDLPQARRRIGPALGVLRAEGDVEALVFALATATALAICEGSVVEARARLSEAEALEDGVIGRGMGAVDLGRLRSRVGDWVDLRQDLSTLELAQPDADRAALERAFGAASHWKARALFAGLTARGWSAGDGGPAGSAVERLQASLGDRVLVEYAPGSEILWAFVLDRTSLRRVNLGRVSELGPLVREFVAGVSTPPLLDAPGVARLGGELYRRLLEPCLAQVPEAKRLVIVPSLPRGRLPLACLPFEALVVSHGDRVRGFEDMRFVLDEFEVVYGPSSEVLLTLAGAPPALSQRSLVVGDPRCELGAEVAGDLRGSRPWPRLRGTRREAFSTSLAGIPQGRNDLLGRLVGLERDAGRDVFFESPTVDLVLGKYATPAVFDRDLTPYGRIHLAAHGVYDPRDPRLTAIVLGPDPEGRRLLRLEDVRGLRLDCSLAVLSACETASGEPLAGEGIQSLALGFHEAGARNVIASQWLVEDRAAQDLMHEFYLRLAHDPPAAALTGAKRVLRGDVALRGVRPRLREQTVEVSGAHPYRWAPFVLSGWGRR
jgi:tetratricopeptide (TPR) repeat protein